MAKIAVILYGLEKKYSHVKDIGALKDPDFPRKVLKAVSEITEDISKTEFLEAFASVSAFTMNGVTENRTFIWFSSLTDFSPKTSRESLRQKIILAVSESVEGVMKQCSISIKTKEIQNG